MTLAQVTPQESSSPSQTTVLIAVHAPDVREGLAAMLGTLDQFRVVGEAGSNQEALDLARSLRPRLALVDPELSGNLGWWTMHALQTERLADAIVALGRRADELMAGLVGARAYVQVGTAPRELVRTLEAVVSQ
ncbi:MAG: hypothetical protein M3336_11360 [Chloroflexota bacterium]|nr:hypothetical protein [Chloroflexota bacterium]